jgi:uncharacterized membrane protein
MSAIDTHMEYIVAAFYILLCLFIVIAVTVELIVGIPKEKDGDK